MLEQSNSSLPSTTGITVDPFSFVTLALPVRWWGFFIIIVKTHCAMTELSEIAEPGWYIDEHGWSQKLPITDKECMLICLENAPLGTDRKQVMCLIQSLKQNG